MALRRLNHLPRVSACRCHPAFGVREFSDARKMNPAVIPAREVAGSLQTNSGLLRCCALTEARDDLRHIRVHPWFHFPLPQLLSPRRNVSPAAT